MTVEQSFSKEDHRTIMKFLLHEVSVQVYQGVEAGRVEGEDAPKFGRPESACSAGNTERVREFLEMDRRMTCAEMADMVGIAPSSIHHILKNILQMEDCRKVGTKVGFTRFWGILCLHSTSFKGSAPSTDCLVWWAELSKRCDQRLVDLLDRLLLLQQQKLHDSAVVFLGKTLFNGHLTMTSLFEHLLCVSLYRYQN